MVRLGRYITSLSRNATTCGLLRSAPMAPACPRTRCSTNLGAQRRYSSASNAAKMNKQRRIELATAYRAMEHCGLHEGVCNHITAMAPAADNSGQEVMLLVPEGLYWSEVTPSCLLGLDSENKVVEGDGCPEVTALCIHRGVRLKHKHCAVVHTHSPYVTALGTSLHWINLTEAQPLLHTSHIHFPFVTALGCLEDPTVRMMHQTNLLFYNKIAYDTDFGGFGIEDEGQRLCDALGDNSILMMGSHGILTAGDSVAIAFSRAYYIERVAMFQMIAMATGKPIREIKDSVVQKAQPWIEKAEPFYSQRYLNSYIKVFAKHSAEFAEYDFGELKRQ